MDEDTKAVKEGLEEAVKRGLLKIVGKNADGELLYSLTKKGEQYVEKMPYYDAIKEEVDNINKGYS